ncbi:MAG: hypothetical protein ACM357_08770, partial [Gemmatimonadota bacterium]
MTPRLVPLLATVALLACSRTVAVPPIEPAPADSSPAAVAEALVEAAAGDLPAVDSVVGPLRLRVHYPAPNAIVDAGGTITAWRRSRSASLSTS